MRKQLHIHKTSKILNPFFQLSENMQPDKKKLQSLKSEVIIANNDDLLLEILVRLPVKSLLRFKSVSKRWFSLISSPDFCRSLHPDPYFLSGILLQSGIQSRISSDYLFVSLRDDPDNAPTPRSLSFVNDPYGILVLQSCNGLLLCSSYNVPLNLDSEYYIYNPATRQHVTLHLAGQEQGTEKFVSHHKLGRRSYWYVAGVSLAFDPAESPHYKVVCARYLDKNSEVDDSYSYQIQIYSSELRVWRLAGNPFIVPGAGCTMFDRGIFCNGAIHWIRWRGPSLYFSVEEEKVQELPMPPVPDGWEIRRYVYFGESRHHLHLIEIYKGPTTQFDIYEMDKDYKGWSVKYRVDLDALTNAFPEMIMNYSDPSSLDHYNYVVVCVSRQVNEDDSYLVLHVPGKIIHYNLKDKTFRKLCDVADPYYNEGFCIYSSVMTYLLWGAFQYLESFCSL